MSNVSYSFLVCLLHRIFAACWILVKIETNWQMRSSPLSLASRYWPWKSLPTNLSSILYIVNTANTLVKRPVSFTSCKTSLSCPFRFSERIPSDQAPGPPHASSKAAGRLAQKQVATGSGKRVGITGSVSKDSKRPMVRLSNTPYWVCCLRTLREKTLH